MKEDHDDFAFEPVPGLPDRLPAGEALLWQGSPDWRALAVSAFHVRKVAAYFALLIVWNWAASSDADTAALLGSSLRLLAVAALAIGILCLLAFLYARGTIYTLTSRRVVIRSGLALPLTLNLPLSHVETASVAPVTGTTASIALAIAKPNRIAFLALWPNARPWRFAHPQPMLRCIRHADSVAPLLARALEAEIGGGSRVPLRAGAAAPGDPVGYPSGRTLAV